MSRRYIPNINYNEVFFRTLNKYIAKDSKLLDVGTGSGKVIYEGKLYGICKIAFGLDINQKYIVEARTKSEELGIDNTKFLVADALKKLEFKDSEFDIITAMFSPFRLKEVYRILKPGGVFVAIFALPGDHKETLKLLPDRNLRAVAGKDAFPAFRNKELAEFKIEEKRFLKYDWIFSNVASANEFYSKILERDVAEAIEKLPKIKNGEVKITRKMGIIVLRKFLRGIGRQAIKATTRKDDLREYARTHKELKLALEKWRPI